MFHDLSRERGVLVIDDEPQIVTAVADVLDDDFRVITETSPQAALDTLRRDKTISVIVCDQRMPRMTGDQLFAQAKDISMATRILLTAYADLEAVIRAVNQGKIFGYVTKPWDPETLLGTVNKAAEFFSLNCRLWHERTLLDDLMHNSLDAIYFKDREHRYIRLNESEAHMLGIRDMEVAAGRTVIDLLPQNDFEQWHRDELELFASGEPICNRIRRVETDKGEERWYAANIAPIRNPSGDVVGIVGISRDITESKKIDKLKNEFVSTVSHELRTPLTSIQGSLGLLRGGAIGELPKQVRDFIEIGYQNCGRLIRLINDILDLEKIDKGEMRFDMKRHAISEIIRDAVKANAGYGQRDNVTIELASKLPAVAVNVDRDRLLQVLANLLSNAMKFSPPGSKVEVRAKTVGDVVRVSVIDHGPGIPEEFHGRIFQKFSQADASDARRNGGVGLGLNISKSIIDLHGGKIDFVTKAGKGSEFFFELPIQGAA